MPLSPLPITRLADEVENRICQYIRENKLSPGDSMPGEIELAESLGVSRNIVREALSRLRMLGMVESKKRRGMIVSKPDFLGGLEKILSIASISDNTTKELFELRLVMELGMIELLFLRKTDEDIKALEELVKAEVHAKNSADAVKYDMLFHKHLYEMAGNSVLLRFQTILAPYFEKAGKEKLRAPEKRERYATHKELLDILKNGNPELFREALKRHLDELIKHFCTNRS